MSVISGKEFAADQDDQAFHSIVFAALRRKRDQEQNPSTTPSEKILRKIMPTVLMSNRTNRIISESSHALSKRANRNTEMFDNECKSLFPLGNNRRS